MLDIGGDPVGAGYWPASMKRSRRRTTSSSTCSTPTGRRSAQADAAVNYLRSIEAVTGLTCTGIVNNTHLCGETTPNEVRKGAALADQVSEKTGIPILCHVALDRFVPELSDLSEPVFPITIQMKKPWE